MARSKFYLTGFGTFTLMVKKTKLITEQGSPFKEFHADSNCMGSIGRKSYCKECNKEVKSTDITKGIPTADKPVIFTKEEIKSLHPDNISQGAIEVIALIDRPHFTYLNGSHHAIVPQDKVPAIAKQGLELFFTTLRLTKKVALVHYFDCGKVYNAIIDDTGIMSGIYYSKEVGTLPVTYESVKDKELIKHLKAFAKTHMKKFKVDITKDVINDYQVSLEKMAMEKQKDGTFTMPKSKKIQKSDTEKALDALLESIEAINNM